MIQILKDKFILTMIIIIILGILGIYFISKNIFVKKETEVYTSSYIINLLVGEEKTIDNINPINDINNAIWNSSDRNVAIVDNYGKVTAIGIGKTYIMALKNNIMVRTLVIVLEKKDEIIDSTSDNSNVQLNNDDEVKENEDESNNDEPQRDDKEEVNHESIEIISSNIELNVGDKYTIKYQVTPSNSTIMWLSSNNSIVSIENNGEITGKSKGVAYITASVSGKSSKVKVTVYEVIDVALLWGQSNMVGRSGKYSNEETTNNSKYLKNIDGDIIANNKAYSRVIVNMPKGVAFEYMASSNNLVDISTNPTKFGENITYSNGKFTSGGLSLCRSSGTNMIPYFAKEYYEKTKHKIVIVHAANGGRQISLFLPTSKSNLHLYDAIILKYRMALNYIKSLSPYYKITNKFYVVYQGESDTINSLSGLYERDYLQVHNALIKDLDMSFGALVYIVRGDLSVGNANVQKVRNAQIKMVKEHSTIIKGTDFPYQELSKGNKSILCPNPNSVHLNSAALSQVGRDVARSIVNSKKLK